MTPNRWDGWEAQEPSADFADRTVAAALRERGVRRRRGGGRRWVGVVAIAATLVAGAAWGFSAWPSRRVAPAPPPPPVEITAPVAPVAAPRVTAARDDAPTASALAPSAPTPAAPRRRKLLASGPESNIPDAGHKPIVPRCDCAPDQVMCTCF